VSNNQILAVVNESHRYTSTYTVTLETFESRCVLYRILVGHALFPRAASIYNFADAVRKELDASFVFHSFFFFFFFLVVRSFIG